MQKRFVAAREDQPGAAWLGRFVEGRNETERWYRGEGLAPPASAAECRDALVKHMPELLPEYDRVCSLVGDDEFAHRILSHYRPPPLVFGCSQAVWLGADGPALVRNYDFPLAIVSDRFESSSWFGREVISKNQRPWGGCLDGMNASGLVASVTFGGSPAQGLGFSVILLVRYVLESCDSVEQGVSVLRRVPIAMSQNVTLLDGTGDYATVFLGPDREPGVSRVPVCTNHQDTAASLAFASRSGTVERQESALNALRDSATTLASLTDSFLQPPLYRRGENSPTVYTAVYRPGDLRVDYLWPGKRWTQRIGEFVQGEYTHDYGDMQGGGVSCAA
jgi:predicted choloylglycine hydrolase